MTIQGGSTHDESPGVEGIVATPQALPADPRIGDMQWVTSEDTLYVCLQKASTAVGTPAVWSPVRAIIDPFVPMKDYAEGSIVLVKNSPDSYDAYRADTAIAASPEIPGAASASAAWIPVSDSTSLRDIIELLVAGLAHGVPVMAIADTPPASPSIGQYYIVGATPTGDFVSHENEVAWWDGATWVFGVPQTSETHLVEDQQSTYTWNGTDWVKVASSSTSHYFDTISGSSKLLKLAPSPDVLKAHGLNIGDVFIPDQGPDAGTVQEIHALGVARSATPAPAVRADGIGILGEDMTALMNGAYAVDVEVTFDPGTVAARGDFGVAATAYGAVKPTVLNPGELSVSIIGEAAHEPSGFHNIATGVVGAVGTDLKAVVAGTGLVSAHDVHDLHTPVDWVESVNSIPMAEKLFTATLHMEYQPTIKSSEIDLGRRVISHYPYHDPNLTSPWNVNATDPTHFLGRGGAMESGQWDGKSWLAITDSAHAAELDAIDIGDHIIAYQWGIPPGGPPAAKLPTVMSHWIVLNKFRHAGLLSNGALRDYIVFEVHVVRNMLNFNQSSGAGVLATYKMTSPGAGVTSEFTLSDGSTDLVATTVKDLDPLSVLDTMMDGVWLSIPGTFVQARVTTYDDAGVLIGTELFDPLSPSILHAASDPAAALPSGMALQNQGHGWTWRGKAGAFVTTVLMPNQTALLGLAARFHASDVFLAPHAPDPTLVKDDDVWFSPTGAFRSVAGVWVDAVDWTGGYTPYTIGALSSASVGDRVVVPELGHAGMLYAPGTAPSSALVVSVGGFDMALDFNVVPLVSTHGPGFVKVDAANNVTLDDPIPLADHPTGAHDSNDVGSVLSVSSLGEPIWIPQIDLNHTVMVFDAASGTFKAQTQSHHLFVGTKSPELWALIHKVSVQGDVLVIHDPTSANKYEIVTDLAAETTVVPGAVLSSSTTPVERSPGVALEDNDIWMLPAGTSISTWESVLNERGEPLNVSAFNVDWHRYSKYRVNLVVESTGATVGVKYVGDDGDIHALHAHGSHADTEHIQLVDGVVSPLHTGAFQILKTQMELDEGTFGEFTLDVLTSSAHPPADVETYRGFISASSTLVSVEFDVASLTAGDKVHLEVEGLLR